MKFPVCLGQTGLEFLGKHEVALGYRQALHWSPVRWESRGSRGASALRPHAHGVHLGRSVAFEMVVGNRPPREGARGGSWGTSVWAGDLGQCSILYWEGCRKVITRPRWGLWIAKWLHVLSTWLGQSATQCLDTWHHWLPVRNQNKSELFPLAVVL